MEDKMMNKTIVQTSVVKPNQDHIDRLRLMASGWEYVHFDDTEIIDYFRNNPLPGFEMIEEKFRAIRRGEHRADLFRYYYIYLNGGFFVDLDFELTHDLNEVVKKYDFISASIDNTSPAVLGDTKRSRAFNGYMYANKKHPIILQALLHLYNVETHDLGPDNGDWDSRYHIVCEFLYHIIAAYPDKSSIKIYKFIDDNGGFIYDDSILLGTHRGSGKNGVPYATPSLPERKNYGV